MPRGAHVSSEGNAGPDVLLQKIGEWRETLAANLVLRNPGIGADELYAVVHRAITGIVFLWACEGRSLEPCGQLRSLSRHTNTYRRLLLLLHRADQRYTAGRPHFAPARRADADGPSLRLDDEPLQQILAAVCALEGSDESGPLAGETPILPLPAEALGRVYERLVSTTIRLTADCHVVISGKRAARKAGGVYYTPTHIVDYVIKNTVGKLRVVRASRPHRSWDSVRAGCPHYPGARGSEPELLTPPSPFRILDPACGSGAFLLAAYQHLLDRHLNPEPPAPNPEPRSPARHLTIAERKRILLNSIFGVDIDPQAVEIARLSLLLAVFEGESDQSIGSTLHPSPERALPDLADNIKCGNSLISPDFYEGQQHSVFDGEQRLRINAFNWQAEFPEVFGVRGSGARDQGSGARGWDPTPDLRSPTSSPQSPTPDPHSGFDAVIGNPPWGQKEIRTDKRLIAYLRERFPSTRGIFDLFRPFVELAGQLCRSGGMIGLVLPDIVLLKNYAQTRSYLLDHLTLTALDWWGMSFPGAVIDVATIIGVRETAPPDHHVRIGIHARGELRRHRIAQADFRANERYTFNLLLTTEKRRKLDHLRAFPQLGEFFEVHEGVHSGNLRAELFVDQRVDDTCCPLLFGRTEIAPYHLRWQGRYVRLSAAPARRTRACYANLGQRHWFDREKLLVRRTGDRILAAVDHEHRHASNNFFVVFSKQAGPLDLDGLCALLNSALMTWYFRTIEPRQGRAFTELKIKHLVTFPLPHPQSSEASCRLLNELGRQRATITGQLTEPADIGESEKVRRAGAALDARIGAVVRQAFGVEV